MCMLLYSDSMWHLWRQEATQLFVQIFEGSKTFSVEPKYDGERIMAHVDVEARLGPRGRE